MKKKDLLKTLIAFGLGLMPAAVSANEEWAHESSDLPVDPAIQWGQLENGLRYIVFPWNEPPERVSLRLVVEAGSLHEEEDQRGLAHFIEHMAFNGTRHFSSGEMIEYFQRLGMAFGPDTNAHTWWRETVYKLELPENDPKILEEGIRLFRDYADGMLFEPEEIEKERGVILAEKRDRDGPNRKRYLDQLEFTLPDSKISDHLTIGVEEVIETAPRETFLDYYKRWYTVDRMIVIAVGEIDESQILPLLEKHFASMKAPAEREPDPDLGSFEPRDLDARFYSDSELPSASLDLFSRKPIRRTADTLALRLSKAAQAMAESALNKRFEKIAKEEGAKIISGQGYSYRWLDFVQFAGIEVNTRPEHWEAGMELAALELKRALEHGFSEAEIEVAKAAMLNQLRESANRAATRKSREISSRLVRSVIDNEVAMDPATRFEILAPRIEELDAERVHAYFRELWSTDDRLLYASGNFNQALEEVYAASQAREVEPPQEEEIPEFAYASFGERGEIRSMETDEALDITRVVFENGVRLNLKPTDFEDNTIRVAVGFGQGKLTVPASKPGLHLAASYLFTAGGLGEHPKEELDKILSGSTVSSSFTVEDEQFVLRGTTNDENLDLQLRLLAAYLNDPGYDPRAESLVRRQLDGLYRSLETNPNGVLQNEVERFLAGGDPRFGYPPQEQLEALTMEDVAAWLKPALEQAYLEINVVGDFASIEKVIDQVEGIFGALAPRMETHPPMKKVRELAFPEGGQSRTFTYSGNFPQALLTVQWPTVGREENIGQIRRLSVLGNVYSDRMRVRIREEIGEAYSPYAYNNSSSTFTDYGYFRAFVGVDPASLEAIRKVLFEIAESLRKEGLTEDELVRALEPTKNQIEEWRRNNNYWLNNVLLQSSVYPYQLDWARTLGTFWDTVTVEQIEALADKFLKAETAVTVTVERES